MLKKLAIAHLGGTPNDTTVFKKCYYVFFWLMLTIKVNY